MLDATYFDAIKQFEGYAAEARWDYAQNTNGYGTRARFAGEVIDKAEADRRFTDEIAKAADFVEKFAPTLDAGSKAALTSLTYNAGTAWAQSGLGQAVESGDLDKARSIFLQYNKAGGSVLDGLVQRRLQEVAWFGGGSSVGQVVGAGIELALASATASAGLSAASGGATPVLQRESTGATASAVSMLLRSESSSTAALFTGLGSDPVLLSLLAQLTKSHLTGSQDMPREPQTRPENQTEAV